jgi:hypothetical protein
MKIFPSLLLAATLMSPLSWVAADVLLLDAIGNSPSGSAAGVSRPSRGLSMPQVRSRYGEPINEFPWVGDPPITRWEYDKFTVYFEHQHVINSVVHR